MSKEGCKGCSASVYLSVEDLYEIIREQKQTPGQIWWKRISIKPPEICKNALTCS